jgi:Ni,Fe-hydrogenase I large subunit
VEGSIRIDLQLGRAESARVAVASSRPVHASRVLEGRPVNESLHLLALLFSVCTMAQSCAGVRACEQALDLVEPPTVAARRNLLVKLETLREHLWRMFLDWPEWLNEDADQEAMQQVLRLQGALSGLLDPRQDLFHVSGSLAHVNDQEWQQLTGQLLALVEKRVFGQPLERWLTLADVDALDAWSVSAGTPAARLLRSVREKGWAAAGGCSIEALPDLDGCELARYLEYRTFVETPLWRGQPRETTALTRVGSPLVDALQEDSGNGLLTRLAARLFEVAQLCGDLRAFRVQEAYVPACLAHAGMGFGQAEAARGRLIHQVVVEDERITRYRILAPTEWNFHPRGVVVRGLESLCGRKAEIREQARLLIGVIDPCVGYELNFQE